jgi:hypothetical protein
MRSTAFHAFAVAAAAAGALAATSADAAPPADLVDLVGVYAIPGENELKQRGYAQVRSTASGGVRSTFWSKGRSCLQVSVANSRFIALDQVDYDAGCAAPPPRRPAR